MPSCCAIMGSPDPRQIDGMGGADPLTSKVAVVSQSDAARASMSTTCSCRSSSIRRIVTDAQNCGNILAGVGPFAIERGLVAATGDETRVAIFMENTGQVAVATVQTPGGRVSLCRRGAHRRRARHPCAGRRSSFATPPARPAARCCRPAMRSDVIERRRLHADRQRHALRGDEGRRRRHHRLREPRRTRERGTSTLKAQDRGDPACWPGR